MLATHGVARTYRSPVPPGRVMVAIANIRRRARESRVASMPVAPPLPFRLPDADDEPFLEVAVAGGADALVTGNARHFKVKGGRLAIVVTSPRGFLDLLRGV